ncbi:MAG: alpha/beta hydrolase [Neisseria sp.]|nr:alpha/beta hydrolase [Neisseria sp.]
MTDTRKKHPPAIREIPPEEAARYPAAQVRDFSISTADGTVTARILMPEHGGSEPPLLALHGISRKADAVFDAFASAALESGRGLIVPRFSRKHWPNFQRIGRHRPDKALFALLLMLKNSGIIPAPVCDIFGYSGGAQLAHRFAMLYPQHVGRLHLGAAGWYCWPDEGVAFPAGIGSGACQPLCGQVDMAHIMRIQLPHFLQIPISVYVGAEDVERDEAMRQTPLLDELQGKNRHERARNYVGRLLAAAAAHSIDARAEFVELPGCGHSFMHCAAQNNLAKRIFA